MTDDQINNWNKRHALLMLVLVILVLFTERIELLSLGAMISFSSFIHRGSKELVKLNPPGGYANWVTGFRLILIIVGSFLFGAVSTNVIFGILASAVLLDAIDGFLARKYGHFSNFGEHFDMEVDAFFVLLMCCFYFLHQDISGWILVPGLLRYMYKIGIELFPKEDFEESKKRYATIIAGIFFVVLTAGVLLKNPLLGYVLMVGSILIVFSFGVSTIEYCRHKSSKN